MALLDLLSAEIKKKRPHMQKKKVLFHQDNAPCHKSMKTMVKLNELGFELLPHTPYSPDLAPSDYWLLADLKKMLQGKRFGSNEEVIAETEAYCILRAKTNHSTKASKSWRSVGINVIRLKETMLMNEVKFFEKTVFFLVRPETY